LLRFLLLTLNQQACIIRDDIQSRPINIQSLLYGTCITLHPDTIMPVLMMTDQKNISENFSLAASSAEQAQTNPFKIIILIDVLYKMYRYYI